MSGNKFLKGAAVLGIAGILVKVMGMFFRVPLTRWLGAAGIADYSSVYPVYTLFLIISTAGIPVAISRMVSERITSSSFQHSQNMDSIFSTRLKSNADKSSRRRL